MGSDVDLRTSQKLLEQQGEINRLRSQLTAAQERIEDAAQLIAELSDHEAQDCRLDHHGYCQAHGWFDESECSIPRARRWLAAYREAVGYDKHLDQRNAGGEHGV